ncbi:MAG TPA: CmcI family methyltransferase [Candidatus Solibacter sp.]|jgi:cephalosporin hydroxylase|nr:CmcI family methyltransferase [Candidatus Solibacter sp.]
MRYEGWHAVVNKLKAFTGRSGKRATSSDGVAGADAEAQLISNALGRAAKEAMIIHTDNFGRVTWLGRPVWQNLTDIWTLQEAICADGVDFVIECGTNMGGSAFFFASIFDLLQRGHVVTIDVEQLATFTHPRITFLHGSSTDPKILTQIPDLIAEHGAKKPMVFLDSDHSAGHVLAELRAYSQFVPVGCYMMVQDGVIDELELFADSRPGPLVAIRDFLATDDRFEIDEERSSRYLLTHSPDGWLRRRR